MKTLRVYGNEHNFQITEKSNNKANNEENPPLSNLTDFDINNIVSYSLYDFSVLVTKDGVAHAIGKNTQGRISFSLPNVLDHFTDITLIDSEGRPCSAISAVCGFNFTLYMIKPNGNTDKRELAYAHCNLKTQFPAILTIGEVNPVSLFGGYTECSCIDSEGGIIYIHSVNKIERVFLPSSEKAVNLAWCGQLVISLAKSGRLFESKCDDKLVFSEVSELKGIEIVSISGVFGHCLAVSKDGRVFVRGEAIKTNYGQLGLGRGTGKVAKFTEISSLNRYKIIDAFAGHFHSIFQTNEGKLLACGQNISGQLLIKGNENVFEPVETTITSSSWSCIAGFGSTAVFTNYQPSMSPNKTIGRKKTIQKSESEILKAKIMEMQKQFSEQMKLKDEQISNCEKMVSEKDAEIQRLKEEVSRLSSENESLTRKSNLNIFDCKTIDKLNVVQTIGRGAKSEVFEVSREQHLALKVFLISGAKDESDSSKLRHLLEQYEIVHSLNHPNIINTFGFCFGDQNHAPSVLLEFCPNNLNDMVGTLTDTEKVCAIVEICLAMEAVHSSDLIHMDLKPENILIDEKGHIKVSDFGYIFYNELNNSKTPMIESFKFMAPEVMKGNAQFEKKVDVYSFGVIVLFILTGKLPKISIVDIEKGIKAKIPPNVNKISRNLISSCCELEAKDRPSFSEIIEIIKSNNFKLIDGEVDIDEIKSFLSI